MKKLIKLQVKQPGPSRLYADSTIAMSAHNLLVVTGGPLLPDSIHSTLLGVQHPGLEPVQVTRALAELIKRGLIKQTILGYVATDRQRRLIISRSLDDVVENEDGTIEGGWTGWLRREPRGGLSAVFSETVI